MRWEEQGLQHAPRYAVIPRTLSFLTWGDELLLLRGAPTKRLWANRLNGIGGHIEPGEDPLDGARREIREETGLAVVDLTLRAVVHVAGRGPHAGVIFFVFTGQAPSRDVQAGREGALEWHRLAALPFAEMVEDLAVLLPQLFGAGRRFAQPRQAALLYGNYTADAEGRMQFTFQEGPGPGETCGPSGAML
ncbi:MAG: NUDIX domain-containing protein [Chloroflexota bacterium]